MDSFCLQSCYQQLLLEIDRILRSLKKPSHYKSAVGEKAKFKLYGNEKIKGEIVSANDESVTITNRDGEREIPYTDIRKAKTYFEW